MIFCDHCNKPVSREECCVDEHHDLHPLCLGFIREYAEWWDANGTLGTDPASSVEQFFTAWLNARRLSIAPKERRQSSTASSISSALEDDALSSVVFCSASVSASVRLR